MLPPKYTALYNNQKSLAVSLAHRKIDFRNAAFRKAPNYLISAAGAKCYCNFCNTEVQDGIKYCIH